MTHHSPSDFNFRVAYWALDSAQKVSEPTSLKLWWSGVEWRNYALLKHSVSGAMEQGRIASWFRPSTLSGVMEGQIAFRVKTPDDGAQVYPFYSVQFGATLRKWYRYTAQRVVTMVKDWASESPNILEAGVWRAVRVTWWNGYNASNQPATAVKLEVSIDGVWYAYSTAYDTQQLNKGQEIQRCGVGSFITTTGAYLNIDDTEFYKPV